MPRFIANSSLLLVSISGQISTHFLVIYGVVLVYDKLKQSQQQQKMWWSVTFTWHGNVQINPDFLQVNPFKCIAPNNEGNVKREAKFHSNEFYTDSSDFFESVRCHESIHWFLWAKYGIVTSSSWWFTTNRLSYITYKKQYWKRIKEWSLCFDLSSASDGDMISNRLHEHISDT